MPQYGDLPTPFDASFEPVDQRPQASDTAMGNLLDSIADTLGLPADNLRAGVVLFGAFPLAALFTYIPHSSPPLRHIYSIIISAFLFCALYSPWGLLQIGILSVAVWAWSRAFGEKNIGPLGVFFGSMGVLSAK